MTWTRELRHLSVLALAPTRDLLMEKRRHLEKWITKIDEMITSLRDA